MRYFFVLLIVITAGFFSCYTPDQLDSWTRVLYMVETSSSPRAIDLNRDGIPDIVLGAGAKEFESTDAAVLALNGSNGEILWKVDGRNQMVGSAIFKDITGDGVPDVFIGGRSAQFVAINGLTGKVLWEYMKAEASLESHKDTAMLNFFNPQFIPDQNGDGVEEILTTFGGYVYALPEELSRPSGMLMVIDPMNGKVLKKSFVPDGKETYMSPVVYDFGKGPMIIFGTGGETIQGSLYALSISDFMASGTTKSLKIHTMLNKGFIAPPVITDITGDGTGDIVIGSMDGHIKTFNGKDFSLIWSKHIHPNAETQSVPSPIYFDDDNVPDFFNTYNLGQWPANETAIHVIVSGIDGRELFRDTLGRLQYSSAVLVDYNDDSQLDLITPINTQVMEEGFIKYKTQLMGYDGKTGVKTALDSLYTGRILGSTPLITDLDSDNKVDVIYTYQTQHNERFGYNYLVIKRMELNADVSQNFWGGYMGTTYTSIFKPR
jgi:outer membrane protein assembly factor BamB